MKFTIRDILWLTAVVAVAAGWCLDNQNKRRMQVELQHRVAVLEAEKVALEAVEVQAGLYAEWLRLERAEVSKLRQELGRAD